MKKKLLYIAVPSILVTSAIVSALTFQNPTPTKAVDSPIVTEIQKQQDELDNHDARISNTESDVDSLQTATNTAPSANKQNVPTKSSPSQPNTTITTVAPADHGTIVSTSRCSVYTASSPTSSNTTIYTTKMYSDSYSSTTSETGVDPLAPTCT